MMLVALVQESNEDVFDSRLSKFKTTILRWEAAAIAMEVEQQESRGLSLLDSGVNIFWCKSKII